MNREEREKLISETEGHVRQLKEMMHDLNYETESSERTLSFIQEDNTGNLDDRVAKDLNTIDDLLKNVSSKLKLKDLLGILVIDFSFFPPTTPASFQKILLIHHFLKSLRNQKIMMIQTILTSPERPTCQAADFRVSPPFFRNKIPPREKTVDGAKLSARFFPDISQSKSKNSKFFSISLGKFLGNFRKLFAGISIFQKKLLLLTKTKILLEDLDQSRSSIGAKSANSGLLQTICHLCGWLYENLSATGATGTALLRQLTKVKNSLEGATSISQADVDEVFRAAELVDESSATDRKRDSETKKSLKLIGDKIRLCATSAMAIETTEELGGTC
jgi:hypothetical protein